MVKRVTLPISTIEILNMYGGASIVTNKLLSLIEKDELFIDTFASDDDNTNVRKISIHIDNEWYEQMSKRKSIISLKKLLQTFVVNELFNEYDFEPVKANEQYNEYTSALHNAKSSIIKAIANTYNNDSYNNLQSALLLINTELEKQS